MKTYLPAKYQVLRDKEKCIHCKVCVSQCSFDTHYFDEEDGVVRSTDINCIDCQRCVLFCPTTALNIVENPLAYRQNGNWKAEIIDDINKQAESGGVILTGMGNDKNHKIYWDHMLLNASQVTNPSIDPLREPMELTTFLGSKPNNLEFNEKGELISQMGPQIRLEVPMMFAAMSYGAISANCQESMARAATKMGTLWNTGEGGFNVNLRQYGPNTIVQVASGRYGVDLDYLNAGALVEIKIGQGAKPGIGGHLPGRKNSADVSRTRMIPQGTDAISPAPHHDIYSIEDLSQLIFALKEATNFTKPVSVKIAAVHNAPAIASGMVRAGADIVVIDGFRGSTGAAPKIIRDNVGIPIEMALASADARLRAEGIRNQASIVASGGIRNAGDVVKAIALGADAVNLGTAALVAMGCHVCQQCHTGKCAWGICTNDPVLVKRINPDICSERLSNMLRGWSIEIKDILGGLGVNAIESLRGNRLHLRAIDLSEQECKILGINMVGE
ncbi:MAG: glutamate synthase-related protein [Chloroflexi bacterium]|nr:glutamate synthase-related protein [Chloroflexota bacterium]